MKLPSLFMRNPEPTEPERATAGPEPIRLILADRDLIGWIEPGEDRVSDLLQRVFFFYLLQGFRYCSLCVGVVDVYMSVVVVS